MSFVGFAAFEAPSPDKQVVTRKGFAGKDRDLERACKQCGKKDASTKLKGLDALVERISEVDANEVRAVAHWLRDARVVELLGFKDDDARVRQGLFEALAACAAAGAPLRSVEASLAGPWWAATADACVAASHATLASTAWRSTVLESGPCRHGSRGRAFRARQRRSFASMASRCALGRDTPRHVKRTGTPTSRARP